MSLNFQPNPRDGYIPAEQAKLYYREIGYGQPLLVLHGGPDFDHTYFLPELDHLAETFRLIYYDQRGRGRSARGVQPEDVSLRSEIEDLERLREYFQLGSVAVLGHSWGAVLALEYALRHPGRVSHLILMNAAPASQADYLLLRQDRQRRSPEDIARLKELAASDPGYQQGDPGAVAAYYRIHFRAALRRSEDHAKLIERLRISFTQEGIRNARAIEQRLMQETWRANGYDLLPRLRQLRVPALVLHGEHDFIPRECATHIAEAIPGSHFVLLKECGHFSFLECSDQVHKEIIDFFQMT
jgi:proline iminopeptidase